MVALRRCGNKGWEALGGSGGRLAGARAKVCGREPARGSRRAPAGISEVSRHAATVRNCKGADPLGRAELNPEPHVLSRAPSACFKAFPCPLPTPNSSPELRGKRVRMRIRNRGKAGDMHKGRTTRAPWDPVLVQKVFAQSPASQNSSHPIVAGVEVPRGASPRDVTSEVRMRQGRFGGAEFYFSFASAASSL
jgi:hypothetical protein